MCTHFSDPVLPSELDFDAQKFARAKYSCCKPLELHKNSMLLLRQQKQQFLLLLIFDLETAAAVAKDSTLLAISTGILLSCRVWYDDATTKDFLWNT
jgi:hypothetical protein